MIQRWIALVSLATPLSLAACAARREPSPVPAPVRLGTEQSDRNGVLQYVRCSDCTKPTAKTLAGAKTAAGHRSAPTETRLKVLSPEQATPAQARTQLHRFTLLFEPASSAISAASARELVQAAPLMRAASTIRIVAYTDNLGGQGLNARLASDRAREALDRVRTLLGDAAGPERPRLSAIGKPLCCYVAGNESEAGRAANRRVELLVEVSPTAAVESQALRSGTTQEAQHP